MSLKGKSLSIFAQEQAFFYKKLNINNLWRNTGPALQGMLCKISEKNIFLQFFFMVEYQVLIVQ